jgi:hypothetical protein
MGFKLPDFYTKGAENILNFVADENLTKITKPFMWCTMVGDVVLQGIDKLLIGFDTLHIGDLSVCTNKEDSNSGTIINCRDTRLNTVASDYFISTDDIKRRVRGTESTT